MVRYFKCDKNYLIFIFLYYRNYTSYIYIYTYKNMKTKQYFQIPSYIDKNSYFIKILHYYQSVDLENRLWFERLFILYSSIHSFFVKKMVFLEYSYCCSSEMYYIGKNSWPFPRKKMMYDFLFDRFPNPLKIHL